MGYMPPATGPEDGICWITGASSGIGKALALELVNRGWKVAISARRADELESIRQLVTDPSRIIPAPLDVTDKQAVQDVFTRLEAEHGPIARAILNVGTFDPKADQLFNAEAYERLLGINVMGTAYCLDQLANAMAARRKGQIAIVASVAGYRGLPGSVSYSSSKAALIALAEALKFSLDKHNVRMQIVNPGFVRTPLTDKNKFPMPFLMEPDAAATAFADGLDASRFEITFPAFFAWLVRRATRLPYCLYFRGLRRFTEGKS
jgi:NAD(P)-dependent dehydrogenase (short-subunit alcohol dehydrogenase family)